MMFLKIFSMSLEKILKKIKNEFEVAIKTAKFNGNTYDNGNKAKEALIRSQKIINYIHDFVKEDFIRAGVAKNKIYPPIKHTNPELKIQGFLKAKNQDIAIVPDKALIKKTSEHFSGIEKILSVNVRSQLSSLAKNIDTLYERTFAEALNLHLSYPKQVLGEVYLIPTHEYDDKAMLKNKVVFKKISKIENYIKMFQAINERGSANKEEYKYERVCLLVVDFRSTSPKLYSDVASLIKDGLVPPNASLTFENLSINNFTDNLLSIYNNRFGEGKLN